MLISSHSYEENPPYSPETCGEQQIKLPSLKVAGEGRTDREETRNDNSRE
jgi:hypothetical protein